MLSNEIHDAPPPVTLLDVTDGERRHLGAPEPAAQEDRQNRTIAQALGGSDIRRVQQRLGLLHGKPVPQADALGRHALHPGDPVGQLGRQEPVVRGFDRQLAHRCDPHIDRNGAKPAGLQRNAPGAHRRLGKPGPRFAPVPLEELVEAEIVNAASDRGRDAIQHQALESLPVGSLRNNNQISHLGPLNGQYR